MQREDTLHSDSARNLADGECFAETSVFTGDNDALEDLNSLPGTFLNLHMNPNGVPGTKLRDIALQKLLFDKI